MNLIGEAFNTPTVVDDTPAVSIVNTSNALLKYDVLITIYNLNGLRNLNNGKKSYYHIQKSLFIGTMI